MKTYAESYLSAINLDALPVKRPKKLQCKPGFVQRGAACQKKTNNTGVNKPQSSSSAPLKALVAAAALAGISSAAVAVAMKKDPQFASKVNEQTSSFSKALSGKTPKLPEKAQEIVDNAIDKIDEKIGKKPSKAQQIGKQIAIEGASKIMAMSVGNFVGGVSQGATGSSLTGLVTGLAAGRAYRKWSREQLVKKFGDTELSDKTKKNIAIAMDVVTVGGAVAATAVRVSQAQPQPRPQPSSGYQSPYDEEYVRKSAQQKEKRSKEKQQEQAAEKSKKGRKNQWHDVLGVKPNASPQEIKAAYRELSKKYHPDVNKSPEAEEQMKKINEAYSKLKKDTGLEWSNIEAAYQEAKRYHPYLGMEFWTDLY